MKRTTFTSVIALGVFSAVGAQADTARDVINGYADLAFAKYSDSLVTAQALDAAIDAFIAAPSGETHQAAKDAWLASRVPYQQTEAYRFGNAVVDDWEGKVNAWPLDEGLIDYVDASFYGDSEENNFYNANVVANATLAVGGQTVDAAMITPAVLQELHEIDGVEANVATGYHAIEFLLWGQDLNGNGPGAGARSYTDFDTANCTNGNCDRRAEYLAAASELLLTDLEEIVAAWDAGGAARSDLDGMSDAEGISAMLTGLGSLSYGELAGERMQLGLILHDPEE
ncbi:MAG: imelysin family protein, partial [Pseudomonadota bacterium]